MKASLEEFLKKVQELSREEMVQLLVRMKEDEMNQAVILEEMRNTSTAMTKDYARLKSKYDASEAENKTLKKAVAKLSEQNAVLNRKLFGRQSEKMDHMDDEPVTEDPLAEDAEEAETPAKTSEEGNEKPKGHPQLTVLPRHPKVGRKKRQGMNLDNLPADHNYIVNVDLLDVMFGPGWEIVNWHTTRKVEHVEEFDYVKYVHLPVIKKRRRHTAQPSLWRSAPEVQHCHSFPGCFHYVQEDLSGDTAVSPGSRSVCQGFSAPQTGYG